MDILGALPLELSVRVLEYLTPAEPIRLRLVSKSYHGLLTSEEVCSALSHHFIKREYNTAKKFDSWRLHYENHVSRRLAYAFGEPWVTEHLPLMEFKSFCPETSYLACVFEPEHDIVQVLDLNTYPAESVFPPTQMPDSSDIKQLVLLPSFVVVVTQANHGYSWNLKTHRVYRFEVPPNLGYPCNSIYGDGNLIAIVSQGLAIVHDVLAEKESSFRDIGNGTRIWEGVERVYRRKAFAVVNSEKRVVWLFRWLRCQRVYDRVFAVDSLHLETGEVVLGEVRRLPNYKPTCGDGPWQFWDTNSFSLHPGPAERFKNAQTRRIAFDSRTGAWTKEAFTIIFPACVTEFSHGGVHSHPTIRSDGLGCLVLGSSPKLVWMLAGEPGDHVTRARLLPPIAPARYPTKVGYPFSCLGSCDKFLVGTAGMVGAGTETGTVVIRFKGIHDYAG